MNTSRPLSRRPGIALAICCLVCAAAALTAQQTTTTQQALERWNKEFAGPLEENLNRQPNAGLVAAIAGRPAGRALDLRTGEGRNAIYLAERGWDVTGVDLSDVAVAQAREERRRAWRQTEHDRRRSRWLRFGHRAIRPGAVVLYAQLARSDQDRSASSGSSRH